MGYPAPMWWLLACVAIEDNVAGDSVAAAGPTDTSAVNDSGDTAAPRTGGPCATYAPAVEVAEVADPALDELSGLAVSRQNPGVFWTHEDSSGSADLFAIDTTGATVATLHLDGVENIDWEDLAIGRCDTSWCITVGDTGLVNASRTDFVVHVVEEPVLAGVSALSATPTQHAYTWPGAAEDVEGVAVFPDGTPLLVTKRPDATAGLFSLPAGAVTPTALASVATGAAGEDLPARATAADLTEDGATLLLRTYLHLYAVDLTVPTSPGTPAVLPFALELQGEAVAWDPLQGGFWQVAEGRNPSLWYTGCAD